MPSAAVGSGRFGIRASRSSRSRAACGLLLGRGRELLGELPQLGELAPGSAGLPLDDLFCAARRASARSVCSRHAGVGGQQRVEVFGRAAPGQRGPVPVGFLPGGLEVNHRARV